MHQVRFLQLFPDPLTTFKRFYFSGKKQQKESGGRIKEKRQRGKGRKERGR